MRDTFMDAVAVNEYPDTLVCALNIRFFDEDGTEIAPAGCRPETANTCFGWKMATILCLLR